MATVLTQTDLFNAALALPQAARADLVERLLASIGKPPGILSIEDPGFEAEVNRRWAAYKTEQVELIDLEEVIERIQVDLSRSTAL